MNVRVKAICLTDRRTIVVIGRQRAKAEPYLVFPGGGVEADDADALSALRRELAEEIAGSITPLRLFHVAERSLADGTTQQEQFWLCHLHDWSPHGGSGREWAEHDPENRYWVDEIAATPDAVRQANLKPSAVATLLAGALAQSPDALFAQDPAP